MYTAIFEQKTVNLDEIEQCPINLTIHSVKKITQLERIAKNNPNLLPPLEIAVLDNKKYLVKRHSVFEALRRAEITEFHANFHVVKTLSEVVALHARLSQANPVNPLAILELRDYLLRSGVGIDDISKVCCLDPSYERLLVCTISEEAKNQLLSFLNLLSQKLTRVAMPPYIIEIITKKPKEVQGNIVKAIVESIGDESVLNDRDFAFPNPDQIRLFADLYKNSTERNALIFEEESDENLANSQNKRKKSSKVKADEKDRELCTIVENIPHMAIMDLGTKKFRVDWKNKTFAEINEKEKPGFIIIRDSTTLQKLYALSPKQLQFLNLPSGKEPHLKTISNAKQLCQLAEKIKQSTKFRGILIFNDKS